MHTFGFQKNSHMGCHRPSSFVSLNAIVLIVCCLVFQASKIAVADTETERNKVVAEPGFYLNSDVLSKNQKGVNYVALMAALKKSPPPEKSEYEKHSEFEKRMNAYANRKVYGSVGAGSRVAVIKKVMELPNVWGRDESGLQLKYNAETGVMLAELDDDINCLNGIMLDSSAKPLRTYMAENGFGRKVKVLEVDKRINCVGFDENGVVPKNDDISFVFNVDRVDAARLKSDIGLVIIGMLSEPFYEANESHDSPTIDSPIEVNIVSQGLLLKVDDLWLMDMKTGRVLAKHKGNFLNSNATLAEGFKILGDCHYPDYSKSEVPSKGAVVELRYLINEDGQVIKGGVSSSSGSRELDVRALRSLAKCKYKPAMKDGFAQVGEAVVKFHFSDWYAKNY